MQKRQTLSNVSNSNIIFIFMYILMFFTINQEIPFFHTFLKFSDEILLISSSLIIFLWTIYHFFRKLKIKLLGFIIFFIWFGYQILNCLKSPFDLKISLVLLQSLIHLKVFLISIALFLVYRNTSLERKLVNFLFYYIIFVFFIGIIGNFILLDNWNIFWNQSASYRYGIIRPIGWFGSPAQNAYMFMLFSCYYLAKNSSNFIKSIKIFLKTMIISLIMVLILTVRKILFVIIPIFYFIYKSMKKLELKYLFILLFSFFNIILIGLLLHTPIWKDTIMNLHNISPNTSYMRGLIIYNGLKLFKEFFPFGTGGATFGTVLSQYNTFEVYNYVGLNIISIISKYGEARGIYDSGLASFLAENGFFGLLIFLLFLRFYFKFFKKYLNKRGYSFLKIIVFLTLLLNLTDPVTQNGLYSIFYSIFLLKIKLEEKK